MDTELAALNGGVLIVEVVIAVVIVGLLVGIVVTNRQRKKSSAPKAPAEAPNYYADLQQQPSGKPDPFGRFAAAPNQTGFGAPASTAPPPAPVFAGPAAASFSGDPGTSGGLDLATSPAGSPAGGMFTPGEAAQSGASGWPSDVWAGGAPNGFHTDAYGLDAQSAVAPVTVAPPFTPSPPPGTPAGWLPDPNGAPDTLRYWDGNAWTQHFAQRS